MVPHGLLGSAKIYKDNGAKQKLYTLSKSSYQKLSKPSYKKADLRL